MEDLLLEYTFSLFQWGIMFFVPIFFVILHLYVFRREVVVHYLTYVYLGITFLLSIFYTSQYSLNGIIYDQYINMLFYFSTLNIFWIILRTEHQKSIKFILSVFLLTFLVWQGVNIVKGKFGIDFMIPGKIPARTGKLHKEIYYRSYRSKQRISIAFVIYKHKKKNTFEKELDKVIIGLPVNIPFEQVEVNYYEESITGETYIILVNKRTLKPIKKNEINLR